ncbi:solute carrier family 2, facilitated glucose transporter member 5-like isoform X2 [Onychostoma macrolepis]|uniref:solute carrier family 2, facilitated glucose transporter member 5-like isoform X2 n=1 Tax=Onychostoma macrolepis TaxID=369639 RepID=UPI00272AA7FB|nr:solute carrier family 2, facilitated glucose transporter member 5-like isoform X2 [Onychostoma macrolepis]
MDMEKSERKGRVTLILAAASLIAGFGSSFQYGYNVAVINSPAPEMQLFYTQIYEDRYGLMSDNLLTLLWSVTVSMYPLGGFFGSLMVAPLVNKFGRKGTLLFNNIFSIVPAIMMNVSEVVESFEIIIVARFLVGICAGLSSNVVPMYLGEIAPKNYRGAIGIVPQLFITIGILVAQVFGIRNILGNKEGWPIMLGLTGIPAAIELLLLPFFPESPRYMLIQKGDEKTARKGLQKLRGWEDVDEELCEMRVEEQSEQAEGRLSVLNLFTFRSLRWQLLSVIFMNMGQQLSGVNAIYYYADSIYSSAGVSNEHVQYVTVGTGAVNVFMTIAATTLDWMPYVSIVCVIVYVIGHAIGPSPIPTVITTEMFRQSSRPPAFMVAGSVHWLSNFTVGLAFPFLERGLGAYCFIIFACICLATLIYIWVIIPETKNKTFLETSKLFAQRNKMDIVAEAGDSEIKATGGESSEQEIKNTFL